MFILGYIEVRIKQFDLLDLSKIVINEVGCVQPSLNAYLNNRRRRWRISRNMFSPVLVPVG